MGKAGQMGSIRAGYPRLPSRPGARDEGNKPLGAHQPPLSRNREYKVAGDLTIRGVTKPAALELELGGFGPDPYGGTRAGFSATTEINRTDFGVSFNTPIPGGVMVSEKVRIEIEAEAVLRKPEQS